MSPVEKPHAPCSARSEEHTSELQSPYDLVCRLLLEKKNIGSGWSTTLNNMILAPISIGYLPWYDQKHRTELLRPPIQPELARIRRLIALGFPAAMQITLEIGVFVLVTALIGRLGAIPL